MWFTVWCSDVTCRYRITDQLFWYQSIFRCWGPLRAAMAAVHNTTVCCSQCLGGCALIRPSSTEIVLIVHMWIMKLTPAHSHTKSATRWQINFVSGISEWLSGFEANKMPKGILFLCHKGRNWTESLKATVNKGEIVSIRCLLSI